MGIFVSNGVANGRAIWKNHDNKLYHFSDGGTKMLVSDIAKINYDDLIIN